MSRTVGPLRNPAPSSPRWMRHEGRLQAIVSPLVVIDDVPPLRPAAKEIARFDQRRSDIGKETLAVEPWLPRQTGAVEAMEETRLQACEAVGTTLPPEGLEADFRRLIPHQFRMKLFESPLDRETLQAVMERNADAFLAASSA